MLLLALSRDEGIQIIGLVSMQVAIAGAGVLFFAGVFYNPYADEVEFADTGEVAGNLVVDSSSSHNMLIEGQE